MLAKLVQGHIEPDRIELAARTVQRELMPAFEAHPGAHRGYWMAHRQSGAVLIMTAWADRESLRASRIADGAERARATARIGLQICAIETLEVVGHHERTATETAVVRWARATWVEGMDGELLDALPAMHDDVVPDQAASAGFCASYWLGDRASGNGLALSLWEGPAELRAGERASRRRRRRFERSLGCTIAGVGEYEALGIVLPSSVAVARSGTERSPSGGVGGHREV